MQENELENLPLNETVEAKKEILLQKLKASWMV